MNRFCTPVVGWSKSVLKALKLFRMPMRIVAAAIAIVGFGWMSSTSNAATIVKANNNGNFNVTSAWSGGVIPGSSDIAVWNNTVTSGNTINSGGGASPSLKGIQILDPGGPVGITFNSVAGNFWSIGSGGIDMSQATQDFSFMGLTLNSANVPTTVATGRTFTATTGFISGMYMVGETWTVNTVGTGIVNENATIRHNTSTLYSSAAKIVKQGTGTLNISGSNFVGGGITLTGGVLKLSHTDALPGGTAATGGTCNLAINGGVLGLTSSSGNFARGLGTTLTTVQFTDSGGFAAFGSDRTVNLGGASASVTWASGSFVPNGKALLLSHSTADSMIDFQNPINFGGATQTVEVDDGSAATDAKLSGALTNGGLTKTGGGTLVVGAAA